MRVSSTFFSKLLSPREETIRSSRGTQEPAFLVNWGERRRKQMRCRREDKWLSLVTSHRQAKNIPKSHDMQYQDMRRTASLFSHFLCSTFSLLSASLCRNTSKCVPRQQTIYDQLCCAVCPTPSAKYVLFGMWWPLTWNKLFSILSKHLSRLIMSTVPKVTEHSMWSQLDLQRLTNHNLEQHRSNQLSSQSIGAKTQTTDIPYSKLQ